MRALLPLSLSLSCAGAAADPFADGPYGVEKFSVAGGEKEPPFYRYAVYAPNASGTYPFIAFVTGGGGAAPAGMEYNKLWGHVVSHGVVVVELSKIPTHVNFSHAGEMLGGALEYFEANLTGIMAGRGLAAKPDFTRIALSGQSAGNHVFCEGLKHGCGKVRAAVMIDPVDGADPFGVLKQYCIPLDEGAATPFSVPALHIEAGYDHVPDALGVACAPAKISNDHYYNAWTGPIWKVNATDYGHIDCGDGSGGGGAVGCPSGGKDNAPYRRTIAGLINAFFGLVFGGDASQQHVLEDVASLPVAATGKHKYNGHEAPFAGYCTHE